MTFEKTLFRASSLAFILLLVLRGWAAADGINGSVDLTNSSADLVTRDSTGQSSRTRITDFLQQYRLYFSNTLYPYVTLSGEGRFQREVTKQRTGDEEIKQTFTSMIPTVSLYLNNPLITTGVRYEMREVTGGNPRITTFQETKDAVLLYRPEGLPPLNLTFTRQHFYDKNHQVNDVINDMATLFTRYTFLKKIDVEYRQTYTDTKNLLTQSDNQTMNPYGRVAYSDRFLNNKILFMTSYMVSVTEFKTTNSGGGTIPVSLFPIAGLSSINNFPVVGAMDPNPALIDGNTTASAGLNIGQLPSRAGDTNKRNMGLDFGIETEVNELYVWVDRQVPSSIAGTFSWDVYTSSDNQNWKLYQTVHPAAFSQFVNRFEIAFANVKTRYIKVVTTPLALGVSVPLSADVNNIFITELQAVLNKPAVQATGTSSVTTQMGDAGIRARIVSTDHQTLMYDMYFSSARSSGQSSTRYIFTNALIGTERFNKTFSGNAKIQQDSEGEPNGTTRRTSTYAGSLLAAAAPLPTLKNNLALSAQRTVAEGTTTDQSSIILSNTADWYPGINTSLGGSFTHATSNRGPGSDSIMINAGGNVSPHRALTFSLNYTRAELRQPGGQPSDIYTENTTMAVSYNPVQSLYLTASFSDVGANNQPRQRLQNYSLSWSAQRGGGALEFGFGYNENLEPTTNTRDRVISPRVTWRVNPWTMLDVSYVVTTVEGPTVTTETRNVVTHFNMRM
ncbi:MAG TPA: hypothetical protein VF903_06895 [Nitrospirota bacterium]